MRYRFYREHKYVSYILSELERLIAKVDFNNALEISKVQKELNAVESLLHGHDTWEDTSVHGLLRKKKSIIQEIVESNHKEHQEQFTMLKEMLAAMMKSNNKEEKISFGYSFYISYRQFVADNLKLFHHEETIIMPELQRLYSDDELRSIEFDTYTRMTSEQMVDMMEILFPHMDANDRVSFLPFGAKLSSSSSVMEGW